MGMSLEQLLQSVGGAVSSEQDGLQKVALIDTHLMLQVEQGEEWATLQAAKANVLVQTPGQQVAEYIEQAIACYRLSLTYRSPQRDVLSWGRTMSHLGVAWRNRKFGSRADNLEEALACYQQLETELTEANDPFWAGLQANLANVWFERVVGDKRSNIEQAIIYATRARDVFDALDARSYWARCVCNLAHMYQERIAGDEQDNLDTAITLYQAALDTYEGRDRDSEWARFHNNLGAYYRARKSGDAVENIERSIQHYALALEIWTQDKFADDWARVQLNLGIAYRERQQGHRERNLRTAVSCLQGSLEVRTPLRFPTDWIRSQHSLALTMAELRDWQALITIAEAVMDHVDGLMTAVTSLYERRRLVGIVSAINNLGVLGALNQNSPPAAYLQLQSCRGLISHAMGDDTTRGRTPWRYPVGDGEVCVSFVVLPLDNEPLPVFIAYQTEGGERVQVVRLTGVDRQYLEALFEPKGTGESCWLSAYAASKETADDHPFQQAMTQVLHVLSDAFLPIWQVLSVLPATVKHLRIVSSGVLMLLPFAALRDTCNEQLLCQRFNIAHWVAGIPAQPAALRPTRQRALLSIIDPRRDLTFSREEGDYLHQLFPVSQMFIDDHATKSAVMDAMKVGEQYSHIHFACHGHFQWRHPEKSGLALAGEDVLAFDEIITAGQFAPDALVVLSACETGMMEYRELPDENYGLVLSFLLSGAGHVVSTLWAVPDYSTKWFMLRFYQAMMAGEDPTSALRTAQNWLRCATWGRLKRHPMGTSLLRHRHSRWSGRRESDAVASDTDRPFAHPFYWAGFILSTGALRRDDMVVQHDPIDSV